MQNPVPKGAAAHEEKKTSHIGGSGLKIGGGIDMKKGEWRCKVCKFKNFDEDEEGKPITRCNMCKEAKQTMKEAPVIVSQIPKVPPNRMHREESKQVQQKPIAARG